MKRWMLAAAFSAAALLSAACARKSDQPAPVPPPESVPHPGPLGLGQARLTPSAGQVAPGETVRVSLEVASGDTAIGAFSAKVFFSSGAFEVVSVEGADPDLGAPFETCQPGAGTLYVSWTNTSPPDGAIKGERRAAEITFRAIGGPGARMHLSGRTCALGDTSFFADTIGPGAMPRDMEVVEDVTVRGE